MYQEHRQFPARAGRPSPTEQALKFLKEWRAFHMFDQEVPRGPEDEDDERDEERYDPEKGDIPERGAGGDESQEAPSTGSPTHDPAEGGGGASQGGGTGNP
jgi:hypothetical protein